MGKFIEGKDYPTRTSMHRDRETMHKNRGNNLQARKKQIFDKASKNNVQQQPERETSIRQQPAQTPASEIKAPHAAAVASDREVAEKLEQLTAAFRATNGREEEEALRNFAKQYHLNLRVEPAVSKTDKSAIARMVFNGGVERPLGGYSQKFADIANYPYKYAANPGKPEDYDLEHSTVWQAMAEEPRLAEMKDKIKEGLAKAGVPKELLPEMNINDFKYLMFNHCAAQKGMAFAKLFQDKDENGKSLVKRDRNGKETAVCTSAKQENVKRFIKENPQFKDMLMKIPGADKNYVNALVEKMSRDGLTDMTKELERHPEWANQPAIDVHHVINIKDCRLFEEQGKSYTAVNDYDNMCIVSNGTLADAINRARRMGDKNDSNDSVHASIHKGDMVFKDRGEDGETRRTMVRLEPQPGVRCMLGFSEDMMVIDRTRQEERTAAKNAQNIGIMQQYNGDRSA